MGVMEGGGVAVAGIMGVATLLGGVSNEDVGVTSFLQGEAEELSGVTAGVVVFVGAVVPVGAAAAVLIKGAAAVVVGVAEGTNGLALALRADPTANVGG